MPKFTDYTEKQIPEDNDSLMLYDAAANVNKHVLFSGFWKWVAKKLNEATISELQTDNKTIIGAINALDGKISNIHLNYYNTTEEQYQLSFIFKSDILYFFIDKNKIRANIKNKDTGGWGKEIILVNFDS